MSNVKVDDWTRGLHTGALEKHRPMLDRVAKENNLDPTILYAMANIESGFNASVGNKNYGGLFAIDKKQHAGKWTDPEYNTREAVKFYRSNERTWQNRFGKDDNFSAGKAYLLHQQGPGGGTALYAARNTNKSAAEVLAPFYRKAASKAGMTPNDYVRKYVIKSNGANPDISARDFAYMWINRADALQAAYAGKSWTPTQQEAPQEVANTEAPKPSTSRVTPVLKPQVVQTNKPQTLTLWDRIKRLFKKTS